MHKLVILIEDLDHPSDFEEGWPEFLHQAEQMPGLRREVTSRVTRSLFGKQAYSLIHELHFDNPRATLQAMESPAGQAAGQILQAITDGSLCLLLADHTEDTVENLRPRA